MASPESKYAEGKEPQEVAELQEDFSTGLFQCCAPPGGCPRCCMVCCCSSCAFAMEISKFPSGSFCCAGSCPLACLMYESVTCFRGHLDPFFGWMVRCAARANVRRVTGIKEKDGRDCLVSVFCPLCATCQELRELDILEQKLLVQDELNKIKYDEERLERARAMQEAPMQQEAPERGFTEKVGDGAKPAKGKDL